MMTGNKRPGRFDTPVEDYMREIRKVKTLADLKAMETKFRLILDDSAEIYASITEETFAEFASQLPKCFGKGEPPDADWMTKYAAIVMPRLIIYLFDVMNASAMPSGFVMNRYLDENLAEITDGKLKLK